jgi:hypothetical protein
MVTRNGLTADFPGIFLVPAAPPAVAVVRRAIYARHRQSTAFRTVFYLVF